MACGNLSHFLILINNSTERTYANITDMIAERNGNNTTAIEKKNFLNLTGILSKWHGRIFLKKSS